MDGVGGYVMVGVTLWMVWVGGCKCSLMLSHCRCYAMDGVAGGKMHTNRTCTHGRWDGVGWMLAVLELATILELAHVHKVLAIEMG